MADVFSDIDLRVREDALSTLEIIGRSHSTGELSDLHYRRWSYIEHNRDGGGIEFRADAG